LQDAVHVFSESLPSEVERVEALVERAVKVLGICGCAQNQNTSAELALREAVANAVLHGNGGDPQKHVQVDCFQHPDGSITLIVSDQGQGFDLAKIPDPTQPENLFRAGGRGIYLIRHFMDDVQFARNGAQILMRKKKD
jgi:serine/threonine-protein kinase RsbW